jgi:hypothetical protein
MRGALLLMSLKSLKSLSLSLMCGLLQGLGAGRWRGCPVAGPAQTYTPMGEYKMFWVFMLLVSSRTRTRCSESSSRVLVPYQALHIAPPPSVSVSLAGHRL